MDRRQLIVNCATAAFYQELATSQIMKNRINTSGELHYKARCYLMSERLLSKIWIKLRQ